MCQALHRLIQVGPNLREMHTQLRVALVLGDRKGLGIKAKAGNHQLVVLLGRSNRFFELQSGDRPMLRAEGDSDGVPFVAGIDVPRPFGVNQRAGAALEQRIETRELPVLVTKKGQTVRPQMLDYLREIGLNVVRVPMRLAVGFGLIRRRIEKPILAERQLLGAYTLGEGTCHAHDAVDAFRLVDQFLHFGVCPDAGVHIVHL